MRIKNNKIILEIEVKKEDWWLLNEKGDGMDDWRIGLWYLAPKIDRSYKGKEPDIGVPRVWLSPEEAELIFKKFKLDKVFLL